MTRRTHRPAPLPLPLPGRSAALPRGRAATSGIALALTAILALPLAAPAQGVDTAGIRAVIERQIAAFLRDDVDAAWTFAAPSIQGKFATPENFGRMVREGYPMIWRPERYSVGEVSETPGGPVQTVTFVDTDGTAWEADYTMRLVDGDWRIAGVSLRRLPGISS